MFSEGWITVRPKSSSVDDVSSLRLRDGVRVGRILPTPAPTPTSGKTVDSDRLQVRSRLRLRSPDLPLPLGADAGKERVHIAASDEFLRVEISMKYH